MESLLLTPRFSEDVFKGNATTPLPSMPYCHPSNAFLIFLSHHLSSCIPTPLTLLSTLAGMLSITSWLFAQMPQIVKNYQQKSAESLSFLFLFIWCLGDSSNLIGAVLLDQMTFQKVVAAYYVAVDVVLVGQWCWYSRRSVDKTGYLPIESNDIDDNGRRPSGSGRDKESRIAAAPATPARMSGRRPGNVFLTLAMLFNLTRAAPTGAVAAAGISLSFMDDSTIEKIGIVLSWCSTFLYLSSRLPQIYLNHQRKSVSGLSPLLFFAAFCGNFFYSSSLLLNPSAWWDIEPFGEGGWVGDEGTTAAAWWRSTLPFLLGSAGVLAQDGYIGLQFWMWGGKDEEIVDGEVVQIIVGVETEDDEDRERQPRQNGKSVEVKRERTYFDEQTALLAQMNGVYGTSVGSSSSSASRG
ncbi:hypothetical protein ABW19_dt0206814 [Dactylella cylindrospora]|nr:hypothetical protein ABW19_dt0206814 [Dactylella cylindrospora]